VADRVLITGGSGFIGTNLVEHYLRAGAPVVNFDIKPPIHPDHRSLWVEGDLRDPVAVRRAFDEAGPDLVFHLGARTDLHGESIDEYSANTAGVRNVIDAVSSLRTVRRTIFASSRMVCEIGYQPRSDDDYCPPNPYGESKVVGEKLVREAALPTSWLLVRPTSIWGPWFGVPYRDFFLQVAAGRFLKVRGRDVSKSFGFVGNSIHQLVRLADCDADRVSGRTFYLGDYPPIRVNEMADRIRDELSAPPVKTVPYPILAATAAGGDALKLLGWKEPPLTRFRLNNLLTEMVMDLSSLAEVVGPLPYTMEEGVRATVSWMRAQRLV
jgi:nucleoside-diphosphate-sugar epimerase